MEETTLNTCENCSHFYNYYIKTNSGLKKLNIGHCGLRKNKNDPSLIACKKYEFEDKNEVQLDLNRKRFNYIIKKLEEIYLLLK